MPNNFTACATKWPSGASQKDELVTLSKDADKDTSFEMMAASRPGSGSLLANSVCKSNSMLGRGGMRMVLIKGVNGLIAGDVCSAWRSHIKTTIE
jgi:hypothetical protein